MISSDKEKFKEAILKLKVYINREIDRVTELHVTDDAIKVNLLKSVFDEYKIRVSKIEKLLKSYAK